MIEQSERRGRILYLLIAIQIPVEHRRKNAVLNLDFLGIVGVVSWIKLPDLIDERFHWVMYLWDLFIVVVVLTSQVQIYCVWLALLGVTIVYSLLIEIETATKIIIRYSEFHLWDWLTLFQVQIFLLIYGL